MCLEITHVQVVMVDKSSATFQMQIAQIFVVSKRGPNFLFATP